jgi:hypothetical protein
MPLDHECPKAAPCPICQPSDETESWVNKLLGDAQARANDCDVADLPYEKARECIIDTIEDLCFASGVPDYLLNKVTQALTYRCF